MKSKHIIWSAFILLWLSGCTEDVTYVNEPPFIQLESISPLEMVEFKDSILLRLYYEDKNGDLGFSDPDSLALWVRDSRLNQADGYFIPALAPFKGSIAIQGVLNIRLRNTFRFGIANRESFYYEIQMRDRRGNWSNTVRTPDLIVKKQD